MFDAAYDFSSCELFCASISKVTLPCLAAGLPAGYPLFCFPGPLSIAYFIRLLYYYSSDISFFIIGIPQNGKIIPDIRTLQLSDAFRAKIKLRAG
jgi:hypothetical protein